MTDNAPLGLVLELEQQYGEEPYYHELTAGMQNVLLGAGTSLVVKIVPDAETELETYRYWKDSGAVAGVFLLNLRIDDPRVTLLTELNLPTVVVGFPETAGQFPAVWTDDASAMELAVQRLFDLGHRRIGRVSGPTQLAHTIIRTASFESKCAELGVIGDINEAHDYTEANGRAATAALVARETPPTAIIYDDDVMAIGGLEELKARGLAVPGDVSILAWDDSPFCMLSEPPLAVMGHDIQSIGELCARSMLSELSGVRESHERAIATFVKRESVGRASKSSTTGS
ncbi:hypothetical protein A0130_13180 [Leifsonia xyli]|uniref:LacI family DNA-binding transcriptional regulator n=1 Tax=Leifsonia xyli TaxID=1575 RepID=UPI0007CDD610|nr:hypothetical protein A0130_13180 [Leifsonia xyli]